MRIQHILWIVVFLVTAQTVTVRAASTTNARSAEPATFSIPSIAVAPVVDGVLGVREWTPAAILPPMGRQPDHVVEARNTRLFAAWGKDALFIGVQHRWATSPRSNSSQPANSHSASNVEKLARLELQFARDGKLASKVVVSPDGVLAPTSAQTNAAWVMRSQSEGLNWNAEIQIPLTWLSATNNAVFALVATVHEPATSAPPNALRLRLRLGQEALAFRFLEGGEYSGGQRQGAEFEIVNFGSQQMRCTVQASLHSGDGSEVGQLVDELVLAPDSRRRFRVAAPWREGRYDLKYSIMNEATPLAVGELAFYSGGPMHFEVLPFFLWREGVFIKTRVLRPAVATAAVATAPTDAEPQPIGLTIRLLDAATKKVVSEMSEEILPLQTQEYFLNTKNIPAGSYVLLVVAKESGKTIALRKEQLQKPPTPAWWGTPQSR